MKRSKKSKPVESIRVCEGCENPLVWTFIHAGCEYYCPSCGAMGDMFMGKDIHYPRKPLIEKAKRIKAQFSRYRKHIISGGAMRDGCEKCFKNEPHIHHATPEEMKAHQAGLRGLERMKTCKGR